jgi:hypothetical protein
MEKSFLGETIQVSVLHDSNIIGSQLGVQVTEYIPPSNPVETTKNIGEFFIDVQVGRSFTAGLTASKNLYIWGTLVNAYQTPAKVKIRGMTISKIMVTTDANFIMLLSTTGLIYAFGANGRGQLGDGTLIDRPVPVVSVLLRSEPVEQTFTVLAIGINALVLVYKSKIILWTDKRHVFNDWAPMKISSAERIASIQSYGSYTLMMTENATLYSTGSSDGQTPGDGTSGEVSVPVPVNLNAELYKVPIQSLIVSGSYTTGVISTAGDLYAWGYIFNCSDSTLTISLLPTKVDTGVKLQSVLVGYQVLSTSSTLLFSESGDVYHCVDFKYQQYALPSKMYNTTNFEQGITGFSENGQIVLLLQTSIISQIQALVANTTIVSNHYSFVTLKPVPFDTNQVQKVILWENRSTSIIVILKDGSSFRGLSQWEPYEKLDPFVSMRTVLVFENNTMLAKLPNSDPKLVRPTGDLKRLIAVSTTIYGVVGVFAKCNTGYVGDYCEIPLCGDFSSDHPSVCNAHGQCLSPGVCKCTDGYSGVNCMTAPLIDDKKATIIGATVGSVGGVFILVFIIISIGCTIRYRTQVVKQKRVEMEMKTLLHESLIRADQLSEKADMEWVIPFSDLTFLERLSEGSFGVVLKGRYKNTDV